MQLIETHTVPQLEKSIRFQEYGIGVFSTISTRSALKKTIKKGLIFVDGVVTSTAKMIYGGEDITLYQTEENKSLKRFHLKLEVLFEDDYLAIINKTAGILVSGNKFKTIANSLSQNLKLSSQIDACKPHPVHRLDYPTTGLLLIGKTQSAIIKLNKLFEEKEIHKEYTAIAIGKMNTSGIIDLPVDEKESISHYEVVRSTDSERFDFLNLVKLTPKTGRRHQLRKHLSGIGTPILGDKEYGKENLILKGKGLYLHATRLNFMHPITQEQMDINKEVPNKFRKIFKE